MNLAQAALPTKRFNIIRFPDLNSCTYFMLSDGLMEVNRGE